MSTTRDGGKPNVRDMNYNEPMGPKHYPASPGLAGGNNYGCCGTQGGGGASASTSGSPGIGGKTHSNGGAQGKR